MSAPMVVAQLSTANFDFVTFASTAPECRDALRRAWSRHRRQTGATATFEDVLDCINYVTLKPGQVARDWSLI